MPNETFYLDGLDARSFGIQLQAPISFSDAVPIVKAQTIPGRNGDLILYTGSYENRGGVASCFCMQKDVQKALSSANRFLMSARGYRRLETSDDHDHFWLAMVENSPQINVRVDSLAVFEIEFDCKPQRFLKDGEYPIVMTRTGSIFNHYGQEALPFITVYGFGSGRLTVGNCVVDIKSIEGLLYLDSEVQNAYNNNGNQNMNIDAPIFPKLPDGEIPIWWDGGIERVEIIPRWWEL